MRSIISCLFSAVALFCYLSSADAVTIFGAAAFGGGASTLYNIDPNTGTATPVGAGIGFDRVGGIDFNPSTGILYGIGANPINSEWDLITINTMTGVATSVGNTGFTFATQDISFRSDGTLFATAGANFYTLNLTTGAATLVGFNGHGIGNGNGIAFDPMDTLYRLDGPDIYTVNQNDGFATDTGMNVNYPANLVNPRTNAMDYDLATGILYGSVVSGDQSQQRPALDHYIAQIDLSTGAVSNVHSTVLGLDALAVQPAQATPTPPPNGNGVPEAMSTLWLLPIFIGLCAVRRSKWQMRIKPAGAGR
jgi:hypothetical protein